MCEGGSTVEKRAEVAGLSHQQVGTNSKPKKRKTGRSKEMKPQADLKREQKKSREKRTATKVERNTTGAQGLGP